MIYAGFWRRLGALLLDFGILLPTLGIYYWGNSHYRLFYAYAFLPNLLLSLFYNIYLVHRLGGTPGKRLAGLEVRKLDGTAIGYREAALRFLPELIMTSLLSLGYAFAALNMTDLEYGSLSFHDRNYQMPVSFWYQVVNVAYQIWVWSELVVMLTNKKRRALHDFIAGTVVILRDPWMPEPVSTSDALFAERLNRPPTILLAVARNASHGGSGCPAAR
jgi:uncharacterized RDD family membrane protein YckC